MSYEVAGVAGMAVLLAEYSRTVEYEYLYEL